MVRLNEQARTIITTTIDDLFPELASVEIAVKVEKNSDSLLSCSNIKSKQYQIKIDSFLKKANKIELYGGIAHELAHIVFDEERNPISRLLSYIIHGLESIYEERVNDDEQLNFCNRQFYQWLKKYVTTEERKTDMLVVKRGGGEKLLKFLEFHNKYFTKYEPEDGLTVRELKAILKENHNSEYK